MPRTTNNLPALLTKLARLTAALSLVTAATACDVKSEDAAGSLHRAGAKIKTDQAKTPANDPGFNPAPAKKPFEDPASKRGFNPQPEPPAKPYEDPVIKKGFNPQPEPPAKAGIENPGVKKGFNPQPEPPGAPLINPGVKKGFNPQPEPPGTPVVNPVAKDGINPQPEPPGKDVTPQQQVGG